MGCHCFYTTNYILFPSDIEKLNILLFITSLFNVMFSQLSLKGNANFEILLVKLNFRQIEQRP